MQPAAKSHQDQNSWPALIPWLPGAYDGRAKWAEVEVIGGSSPPRSFTTPSSCDAQAESNNASAKTNSPHLAEHLFTNANLLIAEAHATSGSGR